jgi:cytochrome c oxidase subunit 4
MNDETTQTAIDASPHPQEALGHVVPIPVLLGVFAALIVLTAITVAVSYFDFGPLNLIVALGVATAKAALVALYFMHLRYDNVFNAVIFVIGIAMLGVFLAVIMLDTVAYHPDVQTWQEASR